MKRTKNEIAALLIERLWNQYTGRVEYAKSFSGIVYSENGKVVLDHIAFRTLNTHTGEQPEGIRAIKHLLNYLGYKPVEKYKFTKKKLNAVHFEHEIQALPKIFVSQMEVGELPGWAQEIIGKTVSDTSYIISDESLELLGILNESEVLPEEAAEYLINDLVQYFRRPWALPVKEDVLKINDVSQYAAWVMLHGNSVNHFAVLTNELGVKKWPDMETLCRFLSDFGIPMKEDIEGEPGSKLRQSATLAVREEVPVKENGGFARLPWTYAYLEFTERNYIEENGERKLFSGFLGEQANHLFDMTETHEN